MEVTLAGKCGVFGRSGNTDDTDNAQCAKARQPAQIRRSGSAQYPTHDADAGAALAAVPPHDQHLTPTFLHELDKVLAHQFFLRGRRFSYPRGHSRPLPKTPLKTATQD